MKSLEEITNSSEIIELSQQLDKVICRTKLLAFNYMTDGFRTGNVWLVGGQTGAGKTQWSLSEAIKLANEGYKVLYISTEMDYVDVLKRCISHITEEGLKNFCIEVIPSITQLDRWCKNMNCYCYMGFDVIFLDYINPVLIGTQMCNYAPFNCPDDQKIVLLLEYFRQIVRGNDEWLEKKCSLPRTYPCLVVLTQLNRMAGNGVPNAGVVQGSFSSANKVDLACNIVESTQEEQAKYASCTRCLYFYKNRNINQRNKYFVYLQYDGIMLEFKQLNAEQQVNWKEHGRTYK